MFTESHLLFFIHVFYMFVHVMNLQVSGDSNVKIVILKQFETYSERKKL